MTGIDVVGDADLGLSTVGALVLVLVAMSVVVCCNGDVDSVVISDYEVEHSGSLSERLGECWPVPGPSFAGDVPAVRVCGALSKLAFLFAML